jgi:uncharacterized cupredoxin-like copper-binding protein
MKNLKKVLALVLAFAMVFTMFASAATYTDVSSDSEYFNAVTLLSDLGIVTGYTDGTYGPDQTITRAEACALVARMLTGKTDVAEYQGASNFTDVAKSYWGESAIGYCVVNNIVVGDGDGKFRPDDAVTQAEFVTMVTRGLGYETASSPLTYPYGYISAAQDNDVLKDVTIVPSEPALRGMDAVIIYNAIFAEYPKMATYKYVNGVYTQDIPTVASYVYHIISLGEHIGNYVVGQDKDGKDLVNTLDKDTTFIVTGKATDVENLIYVTAIKKSGSTYSLSSGPNGSSGWEFDCDLTKSQIDAIKFYETKLYYDTDDDKVVAIEVLDSQSAYEVAAGSYDDTSKDKNTDGEISIDGRKFDLNTALNILDYSYTETKDGTTTTVAGTGGNFEENRLDKKDSYVYTMYDWNNDRNVDWIDESSRIYAYVTSYTEGKKIAFSKDGETIVLDKDTESAVRLPNTDADDFLGAAIDLTDADENYAWDIADGVKEGSVVEIDISRAYSSDAKGTFATYTVTLANEVSDVQFTAVKNSDATKNNDGTDGDYYFDGTKYKRSRYVIKNTGDEEEEVDLFDADVQQKKLGDNFNLYLDRNGYIVYIQAVDSAFEDYMLILNHNDGAYSSDMTVGSPRVYALMDSNTYKTLTVSEDVETSYTQVLSSGKYVNSDYMYHEDDGFNGDGKVILLDPTYDGTTHLNKYVDASGNTLSVSADKDYTTGALVGYKLNESGQISDWSFVGNAYKGVRGDDDHAIAAGATVTAYDDDTYKLTIDGTTNYVLSDKTKIFLYKTEAMGQTGNKADNNSKVITASELAEIGKGDVGVSGDYGTIYVTAVTLSGSANSSTIEAIALQVNDNYYGNCGGDRYPALITGVTQSVVSGSSSKYDYTITAWVQGEEKSLKTEQMSNSTFVDDVLNGSSDFNSAKALENRLAYITMNSNGVVTKIEPVVDKGAKAGQKNEGDTATRAIIVSKNTAGTGLSFIPYTQGASGWSWDTTSYKVVDFNTSTKTANTNYAAYDSDVAFYTINVRPNKTVDSDGNLVAAAAMMTGSVKKGPDGSYKVSSATKSDVLVSTISDPNSSGDYSNVYYVADLFFNKDGDITAVYMYDQDVSKKAKDTVTATPVTPPTTENNLVLVGDSNGGSGTNSYPYTRTLKSGLTTNTIGDVLDKMDITAAAVGTTKTSLATGGDLEASATLAEADSKFGTKTEGTEAGPQDVYEFKIYVEATDGKFYTLTVKYDYTDEEKLAYWGGEVEATLQNLKDAVSDYEDNDGSQDLTNIKNLYASTMILYAAEPTVDYGANVRDALADYKAAVTSYNALVESYNAVHAKDIAEGAENSEGEKYTAQEPVDLNTADVAKAEEVASLAAGDSVELTVTNGESGDEAVTYKDNDELVFGTAELTSGIPLTITTNPANPEDGEALVTIAVTVEGGADSDVTEKNGVYTVKLPEKKAANSDNGAQAISEDKEYVDSATVTITATLASNNKVKTTMTLTATKSAELLYTEANAVLTAGDGLLAEDGDYSALTDEDIEELIDAINANNEAAKAYEDADSDDASVKYYSVRVTTQGVLKVAKSETAVTTTYDASDLLIDVTVNITKSGETTASKWDGKGSVTKGDKIEVTSTISGASIGYDDDDFPTDGLTIDTETDSIELTVSASGRITKTITISIEEANG